MVMDSVREDDAMTRDKVRAAARNVKTYFEPFRLAPDPPVIVRGAPGRGRAFTSRLGVRRRRRSPCKTAIKPRYNERNGEFGEYFSVGLDE